MTQHRLGPLCFSLHGEGFWLRWFHKRRAATSDGGWGISVKGPRQAPMFSEREGFEVPAVRWRGWRVFVLRPNGRRWW